MLFYQSILKKSFLLSVLITTELMCSGAGILPFAYNSKTANYYFLLTREGPNETWTDCGGPVYDLVDGSNVFFAAMRNFCEKSGCKEKNIPGLYHQIKNGPFIKHPELEYTVFFPKIPYQKTNQFKSPGKREFCWIPVNLFIVYIGSKFYKTGKIPDCIRYDGASFKLMKGFKVCLESLFMDYAPDQERYYFKFKNPTEIIARILQPCQDSYLPLKKQYESKKAPR